MLQEQPKRLAFFHFFGGEGICRYTAQHVIKTADVVNQKVGTFQLGELERRNLAEQVASLGLVQRQHGIHCAQAKRESVQVLVVGAVEAEVSRAVDNLRNARAPAVGLLRLGRAAEGLLQQADLTRFVQLLQCGDADHCVGGELPRRGARHVDGGFDRRRGAGREA